MTDWLLICFLLIKNKNISSRLTSLFALLRSGCGRTWARLELKIWFNSQILTRRHCSGTWDWGMTATWSTPTWAASWWPSTPTGCLISTAWSVWLSTRTKSWAHCRLISSLLVSPSLNYSSVPAPGIDIYLLWAVKMQCHVYKVKAPLKVNLDCQDYDRTVSVSHNSQSALFSPVTIIAILSFPLQVPVPTPEWRPYRRISALSSVASLGPGKLKGQFNIQVVN